MKCPNCGGTFVLKDNTYQCKYCGYIKSIERDEKNLINNEIDFKKLIGNKNNDEDSNEKHIKNTNYNGEINKYKYFIEKIITLILVFFIIIILYEFFRGEGY